MGPVVQQEKPAEAFLSESTLDSNGNAAAVRQFDRLEAERLQC